MKYRVITAAAVLTAAAVCIGALTLVFYRHAQVEKWMEKPLSLPDSFLITAHTGCLGTKANSLDSLRAALESGANAVEFDVAFKRTARRCSRMTLCRIMEKAPGWPTLLRSLRRRMGFK